MKRPLVVFGREKEKPQSVTKQLTFIVCTYIFGLFFPWACCWAASGGWPVFCVQSSEVVTVPPGGIDHHHGKQEPRARKKKREGVDKPLGWTTTQWWKKWEESDIWSGGGACLDKRTRCGNLIRKPPSSWVSVSAPSEKDATLKCNFSTFFLSGGLHIFRYSIPSFSNWTRRRMSRGKCAIVSCNGVFCVARRWWADDSIILIWAESIQEMCVLHGPIWERFYE